SIGKLSEHIGLKMNNSRHPTSPYMDKPMVFVSMDGARNSYKVNERVEQYLRLIKGPIQVIGIAGHYRTGKSYLLNRLAGIKSGFEIGHAVEAKTKGIWIYIIRHPVDSKETLILLDTEGLSDATKSNRDHDADIFTLCTLLCSHLVYNSVGKIDQDAIDKLKLVCEMTNHIHTKAHQDTDETGDDFYRFFPTFVWVIRDFSLSLEVKGMSLTADEYLEQILKLDNGVTMAAQQKNAVKFAIKKFFKTRKCFALPIPPKNNEKMSLESLNDSQLQPEFLSEMKNFIDYVVNEPNVKTVGQGMKINGSMYLELVKLYVEQIRKGGIPSILDATDAMSHIENSKAVENGIKLYEDSMRRAVKFPIANRQLCTYHEQFSGEASKLFMSQVIFQKSEEYQPKFQLGVDRIYGDITKENNMASIEKCENLICELYEPIKRMMASGKFAVEGGYTKYCELLNKLERDFNNVTDKGDRDVEVLSNFLNDRETEKKNILMSDEMITKQNREIEMRRNEAKEHERKRQVAEEEMKRIEASKEALLRSHESNLKDIEAAFD
ncbi:GBP1 (predicted), partial [Pycnogonum litorale]